MQAGEQDLQIEHDLILPQVPLPAQALRVYLITGCLPLRQFTTQLAPPSPTPGHLCQQSASASVVVDLDGNVVEGNLKPSSDTAAHLYVYRHRPDVGGIVHTHSPFATAFAAVGWPIPANLTAICDEFGGPIPCGGYARIGGDEIGREVVRSIGNSSAVLLKNHGVFTIGKTPEDAVKAAVMVEDAARTMFYAMQLGEPIEIPPEEIARAHRRYLKEYGQG